MEIYKYRDGNNFIFTNALQSSLYIRCPKRNYIKNAKKQKKYYFHIKKKDALATKLIIESVIVSCINFVSDKFGSAVCISQNGHVLCCAYSGNKDIDIVEKTELFLIDPNGETITTKKFVSR